MHPILRSLVSSKIFPGNGRFTPPMSVDEWEVRPHFCVLRCLSNCSKRVEISVFFEALAKSPQELMVSFRDLLGDSTENKHQRL